MITFLDDDEDQLGIKPTLYFDAAKDFSVSLFYLDRDSQLILSMFSNPFVEKTKMTPYEVPNRNHNLIFFKRMNLACCSNLSCFITEENLWILLLFITYRLFTNIDKMQ